MECAPVQIQQDLQTSGVGVRVMCPLPAGLWPGSAASARTAHARAFQPRVLRAPPSFPHPAERNPILLLPLRAPAPGRPRPQAGGGRAGKGRARPRRRAGARPSLLLPLPPPVPPPPQPGGDPDAAQPPPAPERSGRAAPGDRIRIRAAPPSQAGQASAEPRPAPPPPTRRGPRTAVEATAVASRSRLSLGSTPPGCPARSWGAAPRRGRATGTRAPRPRRRAVLG